jgi:HEAT repeat protein
LAPLLRDEDGGVRKAAVYAIGKLGGGNAVSLLLPLLRDREVDVTWNAALGLAALGSDAGGDVLREMLDRERLMTTAGQQRAPGGRALTDREVSDVLINAARAAARLGRPEFRPALRRLRDEDKNPSVQEAARLALARIN